MNIPTALKIKEDTLYKRYFHHPEQIEEADKLSIEALKRCKVLAENDSLWAAQPLPGETEE